MKTKKGSEFFYNFSDETIETESIVSAEDMFSLLHEFGHHAMGHKALPPGKITLVDVRRECEAWGYALRCVRPQYVASLLIFALQCVQTYNSEAEINYGEWFKKEEIIKIITKEKR